MQMDNAILTQAEPQTEAEYRAAIAWYQAETQRLIEEMHTDQVEIERLRDTDERIWADIRSMREKTRAIIAQLEATLN